MNTVDDASVSLSSAIDIGLALQRHREKKNISPETVARELRLSVRQVSALESGQFASFRSPVFVKGYLRICAKLYGIDGDALVRAYESVEPKTETETVLCSSTVTANREVISAPKDSKKYWVAGFTVLVVAISYWQWMAREVSVPIAQVNAAASVDNQADVSLNAVNSASEDMAATAAVLIDNTVPDLVVAAESASPISPVAASDADADNKVDAQDSVLHIEFSDDCWVQVKNEEGKVLHEKNYRKGEVLDLTAPPPLRVWLGRAASANVSYNGVLVSVPIKPGYQTVQFVLGDDTQSSRVE